MKYFVNVGMGLGGNISLSQYVTELKKKDPSIEVAVMSPYNDVFESTTAVDFVYTPNQAREFLFDAKAKDATIITTRLYDLNDFIYKRMNYAQAWDELFGNPLYGKHSKVKPVLSNLTTELYTSKYPQVIQQAEAIKKDIIDKGYDSFTIVQFFGGQSPLVQVPISTRKKEDGTEEQFPDWSKLPYSFANEPLQRHYPVDLATKFVKLYKEKNPSTAVIAFQLPNEPKIEGTLQYVVPYLVYYELAKMIECKEAVCIDSCLHHLLAGICPVTVIWGHSLPDSFGYSYQKNIIQDCRRDDIIYMSLLGPCANKVKYISPEKLLEKLSEEKDEYIDSAERS